MLLPAKKMEKRKAVRNTSVWVLTFTLAAGILNWIQHQRVNNHHVRDTTFNMPSRQDPPPDLLWGAPSNLTEGAVESKIADIQVAVSQCPEFQCAGWPGRRNCTGILPNPVVKGDRDGRVFWSPLAREKDCSRTKLGSWDFDGNSHMDLIVFYLFFYPEMVRGLDGGESPLGRKGIAVEFGAQNGIDASNSRFYERHLGWSSLLVEPTSCHNAVRRNRPGASVVHGAVCRERGSITIPGSGKWCKGEDTGGYKSETVQCYPLSQLFEMHGRMSLIDFVSVDSEGMEMEALESIDFSRVDIRVLVVEWRKSNGSERRDYMAGFGYRSAFISKSDELFWRPDLFQ